MRQEIHEKVVTYPNNEEDEHDTNQCYNSSFKPVFAILRIETQFMHIAHELRVVREFFANSGAGRWNEGGIGGPECD
jgi:hypothetical protein